VTSAEHKRKRRAEDPEFYARELARNREWQRKKRLLDPGWAEKEKIRKQNRKNWSPPSPETLEKGRVYNREAYRKNPERHRDQTLRRKYGISLEQFDTAFLQQGGKCRICSVPMAPRGTGGAQADHNHITGKFRALLCPDCNKALGGFKDSRPLLKLADSYLEEFSD
jgi:hypothetical protein